MNLAGVAAIADAILYEGYLLYPYRRSSLKNQRTWSFGGLDGGESLQCEWLVEAGPGAEIELAVRFLEPGEPSAVERTVLVGKGRVADLPVRHDFEASPHAIGRIDLTATVAGPDVFQLSLRIANLGTGTIDGTHAIAALQGGGFVSSIDPPQDLAGASARCRNRGLWPVLAGAPGTRDVLLCSPVILDDHPAVAPESPGDLYDGTEIDEILTLRILTLSDTEREEIMAGDPRARALIERTGALGAPDLGRLHGALRRVSPVAVGDRVTLAPKRSADILDLALAGRTAQVVAIEHDYGGRIHVAVTIDADPGRDLGESGQPGHRFFFDLDEVIP